MRPERDHPYGREAAPTFHVSVVLREHAVEEEPIAVSRAAGEGPPTAHDAIVAIGVRTARRIPDNRRRQVRGRIKIPGHSSVEKEVP